MIKYHLLEKIKFFVFCLFFGGLLFLPNHLYGQGGVLLVKGDQPAVFYLEEGRKYLFPNEFIYKSWFPSWSNIQKLSQKEIDRFTFAGQVLVRPGTWLVKKENDPKVYAVLPGKVLRWIPSEEIALSLYGQSWWKRIKILPESLWINYQIGEPLSFGEYPSGSIVKAGSDYYLILGFQKRKINSKVFSWLNFDAQFFVDPRFLNNYSLGEEITEFLDVLKNPSQKEKFPFPDLSWFTETKSKEITIDSQNNILADFILASGNQGLILRQIKMKIKSIDDPQNASDGNDFDANGLLNYQGNFFQGPNLKNFKIIEKSSQKIIFGPAELQVTPSLDGEQEIILSGELRLKPQERKELLLSCDVPEYSLEGKSFQYTIDPNQFLIYDFFGQPLTRQKMNLFSASFSLTKINLTASALSLPKTTVLFGSPDVVLGGFSLRTGKGSLINIQEIKIQTFLSLEANKNFGLGIEPQTNLTKISDLVDQVSLVNKKDNQILKIIRPGDDGLLRFSDLNLQILPGESFDFWLKADLKKAPRSDEAEVFLAFDLVDEESVLAFDASQRKISLSPLRPNNFSRPKIYLKILPCGTLIIGGSGGRGGVFAASQKDVLVDNLSFKAQDENFIIKNLAFKNFSLDDRAIKKIKIKYLNQKGETVIVDGKLQSSQVSFKDLDIYVKADDNNYTVSLLADFNEPSYLPSGAQISFAFDSSGFFQALGEKSGRWITGEDLGKKFFLNQLNKSRSTALVRKNLLSVKVSPSTPQNGYRGFDEVFHFDFQGSNDSPILIRKLTFEIRPSGASQAGPFNDFLEIWANTTKGFYDADSLVDLVEKNNLFAPLGEGGNGKITLKIINGNTHQPYSDFTGYESHSNDYALVVFDFNSPITVGKEAKTFILKIDASSLPRGASLQIKLLGGDNFVWLDDWKGLPLPSSEVGGLPISVSLYF